MTYLLKLSPALVPVLRSCVELGAFNCDEALARMSPDAPEFPVAVDLLGQLAGLLKSLCDLESLPDFPDLHPEDPF